MNKGSYDSEHQIHVDADESIEQAVRNAAIEAFIDEFFDTPIEFQSLVPKIFDAGEAFGRAESAKAAEVKGYDEGQKHLREWVDSTQSSYHEQGYKLGWSDGIEEFVRRVKTDFMSKRIASLVYEGELEAVKAEMLKEAKGDERD